MDHLMDAPTRRENELDRVRTHVREYARKDVFRHLKEEVDPTGDRTVFAFDWLSTKRPLRLAYDARRRTLTLDRIFPDIPSDVEELGVRFLQDRQEGNGVPEHKRIDGSKVSGSLLREGSDASLVFRLKDPHAQEYCVRKLVNFTNELFFRLQLKHGEYMLQAFGGSDE